MDAQFHKNIFKKLCRVCGGSLSKAGRTQYMCSSHSDDMFKVFSVDVSHDIPAVHPQSFCHRCKNAIYFTKEAEKPKGKAPQSYKHHISVYSGWAEHSGVSCDVCIHASTTQKGGRPRKVKIGRPALVSPRTAIRYIQNSAPASFFPSPTTHTYDASSTPVKLADLTCPICTEVLDRPIEMTTCGAMVCAGCCCRWLEVTD